MIPPAVISLSVKEPGKKGLRLWLPVFILWPIMLIIAVPVMIASILVDVVLYVVGRPYHHYTLLLLGLAQLLSEIRGTRVDVSGETTVHMTVS